jgi:hypothetical protein
LGFSSLKRKLRFWNIHNLLKLQDKEGKASSVADGCLVWCQVSEMLVGSQDSIYISEHKIA